MIDMLDWRKERDDWFGEVTRQLRLQAVRLSHLSKSQNESTRRHPNVEPLYTFDNSQSCRC